MINQRAYKLYVADLRRDTGNQEQKPYRIINIAIYTLVIDI